MDGIGSLLQMAAPMMSMLEGVLGGGSSGQASNPLASLFGGGDSIQSSQQQQGGGGNQTGQIIGDIAQALPLVMAFL